MTNAICKTKLFCLLVGLMFALSLMEVRAQVTDLEKSRIEFESRKAKIQEELSELKNHEWAGEYTLSSQILFIAPKSGFAYFLSKNLWEARYNYGNVELFNGKIKLIPEISGWEVLPSISSGLFPVSWGERHYLIATDEVVDFVNSVNIGYEPSSRLSLGSGFFLKRGDEYKSVSGKPNIPEQYRSYLLEKPIKGKLITIKNSQIEQDENQRQRTTTVILNVGRNKGVLEGMKFLVYRPRRASSDVKVTKVESDWSEGVVIQTDLEGKVPAVGWKVSTSLKDIK
jgi:hypothetical protein